MTFYGFIKFKELEGWIRDGKVLEMRAAAATVAEPAVLKNEETAISALQLHRKIIAQVLKVKERKSEGFRILRKALGYTLSVVVREFPKKALSLWLRSLIHKTRMCCG